MISNTRNIGLYSLVFLLSLVLTAITIYHYPVFNPDGIIYLETASIYLQQGFFAAHNSYIWPFYSIMIAIVHLVTHLSFLNSAYLLNALFSAFTVVFFLMIVNQLTPSVKILWIAAIVFLVFHPFNSFRADLIRDHGYWCFLFLSLLFLIDFSDSGGWLAGLAWAISIIFAALFRFEGFVFLVLLPWVVFCFKGKTWGQRLYAYGQLNFVTLVAILILIIIYLFKLEINHLYFIQVPDVTAQFVFFANFLKIFSARAVALETYVLPSLGIVNSHLILLLSLFFSYIVLLIEVISAAYILCLIYACRYFSFKKLGNYQIILFLYLLITVLITGFYYINMVFLSNRYIMSLALIALCYVPLGLENLYEGWRKKEKYTQWIFVLVVLFMIIMFIGSIHRFGPSKRYIYEAGYWLQQNSSPQDRIYTNEHRLAYFAERDSTGWNPSKSDYFDLLRVQKKSWQGYNYVAIVLNQPEQKEKMQQLIGKSPIKTFYDERTHQWVLIFKLSKNLE